MADVTAIQSKLRALRAAFGTGVTCVLAVLQFVLADPILRSTIVTFLETLKAQIELQKSLAQAAVQQATISAALLNTQIQALEAVGSTVGGLGNRFPLERLLQCPPLGRIVNEIKGSVVKAQGGLPTPSPLAQAKTKIRNLKYYLFVLQKKIDILSQKIEDFDLFIVQIDAIIDLVNVLADVPTSQIAEFLRLT